MLEDPSYSLVTTRVAMLVIAAFSLTGLVRLAEVVANRQVAIATAVCTAIYPVFFVQSSLAQVDLAAAGFTFWGLHAYIQNRRWAIGFWMSLAALTRRPPSWLRWRWWRGNFSAF